MTPAEIRMLYAYNEWANRRIFDAVEQLGEEQSHRNLGSSFPSIVDTMAHIVGVEWVWLRRWKGESPSATPEWMSAADVRRLRAKLRDIEGERALFLDQMRDEDLPRVIGYTNFKGEHWDYSLADMLLHLINHSTYHRGQVTTMLRQVGAVAPATDLLVYKDVGGR